MALIFSSSCFRSALSASIFGCRLPVISSVITCFVSFSNTFIASSLRLLISSRSASSSLSFSSYLPRLYTLSSLSLVIEFLMILICLLLARTLFLIRLPSLTISRFFTLARLNTMKYMINSAMTIA